ncbi:hypothetical protein [Streptomyces bungoensis]|uniref:hypothetical protein n=1 Tax=Streptomyces bungoensis TaxID=285568 RepID=UPI0033D91B6E
MSFQAWFEDPAPFIQAGLNSGIFTRDGGVIRDRLGKIVAHLVDAPAPAMRHMTVSRAGVSLSWPGVIVTAAALSVVTVGARAALALRKREPAGTREVPPCVAQFNRSLSSYLDAVSDGTVDVDIIDQVIADLDVVKAYSDIGSITVDFSMRQAVTLVSVAANYTRKLAEECSVDLSELDERMPVSEDDAVVDLRRHLVVQRTIIPRAA